MVETRIVLDSSAIFAVLYGESGAAPVLSALADETAAIFVSSVNLSEVVTKLVLSGADASQVSTSLSVFLQFVVDFDTQQALYAGNLARETKRFGLSLGDRACLALAATRDATAWTTDAAWQKLKLSVKVRLLRAAERRG